MVPELEKPRVTEIKVRMDCNGCVQKIKKALHGINGIYDLYIDFPQQKLTVIGWADPEKIAKAIRKTRKTAIICSHSEPTEQPPAQPPEQSAESNQPPPEAANPPPPEEPQPEAQPPSQPDQATPLSEPPKDQPPPPLPVEKPPPPAENPPPEGAPAPAAAGPNASQAQTSHPPGPKDVGEVHVIYHYPPDYGYRYGYGTSYGPSYGGHWSRYASSQNFPPEPPQPAVHVTHSYNTYKPSPNETEYEYIHPPPLYTNYSRMDHYNDDYHENNSRGNGNITSMFSDENPNACRII